MNAEEFKTEVLKFSNEETVEMLQEFFDYWSEPNTKGKMRWQFEKTWDLSRRIKRWSNNNFKWHGTHKNSNGQTKPGTSEARVINLRKWG